eukprot:Gb_16794 [translate_table: standard]
MGDCHGNLQVGFENENVLGKKKVGIVGAGMSGIMATKYLLNMNPIVFEAKPGIGGVWRQTFASTKLQTPRPAFQFTDFPWPDHVTAQFPTQSEVMDYFHRYAEHFGLLDRIHFNSKVVEIRYIGEEGQQISGLWGKNGGPFANSAVWEVGVENSNADSIQWHRFDFLVLCIGRYGDLPKIPSFPPNKGPEVFQGKALHTMEYSTLDKKCAYELIKGKRVVVIGYQKSAMDFAAECAEINQGEEGHPCTMIFRTLHWMIPDHRVWGVPLSYLYGTRNFLTSVECGMNFNVHSHPPSNFCTQFVIQHWQADKLQPSYPTPKRWAVSKFVELYLLWKLPLRKFGLVPNHTFLEEISSCQIASLPDNLFTKVEEGRILFQKSLNWNFSRKGIVLEDKSEVEADVVVLGTGYDGEKKLKALLPKPFADVLEESSGVLPLYRGLIHPHIPHVAFLGYPESLSNLHSSELRCRWLANFLNAKFILPCIKEMEAYTDTRVKHMKRITPFYWKSCLATFQIWDNDELCRDMGWNPMRKKNWFHELFSPYNNLDYQEG